MRERRSEYLGRVQALRFFAAAAVLFAHLQHEVLQRLANAGGFRPFSLIDGGIGVDLFFVISGFIMYHVSADKFGWPGAVAHFLVRRYLRIAPLYYLATAGMLAATFAFSDAVSIAEPAVDHVIYSLLFIPAVNAQGEVVPVLKLGWTLNYEAYFYLMFGLALAFNKRLGLIVMGLGLASVVVLAATLARPPVAIAFWGQSLVFEFLSGVGIAMLYARGIKLPAPGAWALIAAALALLAALRVFDILPHLPRAAYAGLPAALIVLAVVAAPFDEGRQTVVKRVLAAGGEASYAIYVTHPFGIRAGALIWDRFGPAAMPWLYITVMMLLVIACAFAVNILIERPLNRWLGHLLLPARQPRSAMPAPSA